MGYHKFVTNCRNPHKSMRRDTSARALHSSHRSCFEPLLPREELTERQQMLLEGTHPNPNKAEVGRLLRKFEYYERFDDLKKIYDMYGYLYHEIYEGDPTPKEALEMLAALTPDDLK